MNRIMKFVGCEGPVPRSCEEEKHSVFSLVSWTYMLYLESKVLATFYLDRNCIFLQSQ